MGKKGNGRADKPNRRHLTPLATLATLTVTAIPSRLKKRRLCRSAKKKKTAVREESDGIRGSTFTAAKR